MNIIIFIALFIISGFLKTFISLTEIKASKKE